jgi:hypothetical protein
MALNEAFYSAEKIADFLLSSIQGTTSAASMSFMDTFFQAPL